MSHMLKPIHLFHYDFYVALGFFFETVNPKKIVYIFNSNVFDILTGEFDLKKTKIINSLFL